MIFIVTEFIIRNFCYGIDSSYMASIERNLVSNQTLLKISFSNSIEKITFARLYVE